MKDIRELLRNADPLRDEPAPTANQRDLRRAAVLSAAAGGGPARRAESRSRLAFLIVAGVAMVAASLLIVGIWSPLVGRVEAAVRFEVRLAEDRPAAGLTEAKEKNSGRTIYLHPEIVVGNADIAAAQVVEGGDGSHYSVSVEFTARGAEKMRAATRNHIGKPVAILLDGEVVLAPTLRSEIGASARITGSFTKQQAQRIAEGIQVRSGR
jgi:hypothetical protein